MGSSLSLQCSLTLCVEGTEESCGLKTGIPESFLRGLGHFYPRPCRLESGEERDSWDKGLNSNQWVVSA